AAAVAARDDLLLGILDRTGRTGVQLLARDRRHLVLDVGRQYRDLLRRQLGERLQQGQRAVVDLGRVLDALREVGHLPQLREHALALLLDRRVDRRGARARAGGGCGRGARAGGGRGRRARRTARGGARRSGGRRRRGRRFRGRRLGGGLVGGTGEDLAEA